MVMKRFEIIEKLYLSKALLKMAGGGDASPTSPPPWIRPWWLHQFLFVCLHLLMMFKIFGHRSYRTLSWAFILIVFCVFYNSTTYQIQFINYKRRF